jgi:hypothetical protein
LRCTFTSNAAFDGKTSTTLGTAPLVIAPNLNSQSAPTSYPDVIDNFGQKTWNLSSDTSKGGMKVYLFHRLDQLGWSPTEVPSAVTGPYSGCPGGIGWYGSGFENSLDYGRVMVSGIYQFSGRK